MRDYEIVVNWDGSQVLTTPEETHPVYNDTVHWCTDGSLLELHFPAGLPFATAPGAVRRTDGAPAGKYCGPNSTVNKHNGWFFDKEYKYNVSLTVQQGQSPHVHDPKVIIDGGRGQLLVPLLLVGLALIAVVAFNFIKSRGRQI